MRKNQKTRDEVTALARKISADESGKPDSLPPSELLQTTLELLYAGQIELGWYFFDAAWPANIPGKEENKKEFCKWLAFSPYWKELEGYYAEHDIK